MVGEAVSDEGAELLVERVTRGEPVAHNHKGARDFSGLRIGLGDYAAVPDGGVFEQDGFYLGWGDGESFVLDHFFAAIEDVVEPVGVALALVQQLGVQLARRGAGRPATAADGRKRPDLDL